MAKLILPFYNHWMWSCKWPETTWWASIAGRSNWDRAESICLVYPPHLRHESQIWPSLGPGMDRAPRSRPDAFRQCGCSSLVPFHGPGGEAWQLPSLVPSRSSASASDPLMYLPVYFIIPPQEHLVRTKLPPNPSAVFQSRSRVFNMWTPLQSGGVLPWLGEESTAERSPSCHTRIYAVFWSPVRGA